MRCSATRRRQQDGRGDGASHRREVEQLQFFIERGEALLEGQRKQEAGEQLDSGQHDAQLLQQRCPVAVETLSARLVALISVPHIAGNHCCRAHGANVPASEPPKRGLAEYAAAVCKRPSTGTGVASPSHSTSKGRERQHAPSARSWPPSREDGADRVRADARRRILGLSAASACRRPVSGIRRLPDGTGLGRRHVKGGAGRGAHRHHVGVPRCRRYRDGRRAQPGRASCSPTITSFAAPIRSRSPTSATVRPIPPTSSGTTARVTSLSCAYKVRRTCRSPRPRTPHVCVSTTR
jgi:hypothetical protein